MNSEDKVLSGTEDESTLKYASHPLHIVSHTAIFTHCTRFC